MSYPRKNTRVMDRRVLVAKRYLQGEHQTTIARDLGVSQVQISKDLAAIRKVWLTSAVRDFDALTAEQLAKLDEVEQAAWSAFSRSKDATHVGESRWLQIVLDCVSRRCDLLGLNAPKKFVIDWDTLTDAQLECLAKGESVTTVLSQPATPLMAEA